MPLQCNAMGASCRLLRHMQADHEEDTEDVDDTEAVDDVEGADGSEQSQVTFLIP